MLLDTVDRADVRVIERGCGAGFATEPLDRLIARRVAARGQHLERDLAAKLRILRAVHHSHPASAELIENPVVPEGLANEGVRHGGRPSYARNALTAKGANGRVRILKRLSA